MTLAANNLLCGGLLCACVCVSACKQASSPASDSAADTLAAGSVLETTSSGFAILRKGKWDKVSSARQAALEKKRQKKIRHITIHYTGSRTGDVKGKGHVRIIDDIASGHRTDRGWADLAYHFFIFGDGTVGEGRNIHFSGDSGTAYNLKSGVTLQDNALVVVDGNFQPGTEYASNPSVQQLTSLKKMVACLARTYKVPVGEIYGHRQLANTDCPGENLWMHMGEIKEFVQNNSPQIDCSGLNLPSDLQ